MEKRLHSITISILMSLIVWTFVNFCLIAISWWHFIIIEVVIGISELFSIFVKKKFGLLNPEDIKFLENKKEESEDGLQ